ncbi:MAG: TIR domain-containing protein [bacterium]
MEKKQKIFISHSSKDNWFTDELKQKLEENGFETWLDKYDLHVGELFSLSIVSQIADCDYFCIILTDEAMKSNWVKFEFGYAFNNYVDRVKLERAFIIPILLSPCNLWGEISPLHYIDFTINKEFETLINTLKEPKSNYLFSRQKEFRPPIKEPIEILEAPKDYFERELSQNEIEPLNYYFDKPNLSLETLPLLIQKHNYICVLSEAGVGKSTELANLAYILANNEMPFQPYYYKLNKYSGEEIINYIPKLKTTLSGFTVLILDGYDEIESSEKKIFLRKLENFADHFPMVSIVISSRSNLKPTINNFNYFYIQELSYAQIKEYCNKKNVGNGFLQYFEKSELYDLLKNPFYLANLVNLYNQNETLPKSKAAIFEEIINLHLSTDQMRNNLNENLRKYGNYELVELIKKIAIIIETTGKRFINENDLVKIIKKDEKEILKHCGIFTISKTVIPTWQFIHNLLQEYCAAKYLSEFDIEKIKKVICFTPDYKILKPTWLNALSILLEIWEQEKKLNDELVSKIYEISKEAILTIEAMSISNDLRHKIFFEIYNDYCNKNMRTGNEIVRNLALFVNNKIINELFTSIENCSSAIHVINFAEIVWLHKKSIIPDLRQKEILFNLFEKWRDEIVIHELIYALRAYKLNNFDINRIFNRIKFIDNSSIRAAFYSLLNDSDYVEEYFNFLIDGIKYIVWVVNTVGEEKTVRLVDEAYYLELCLSKLKSYEALKAILQYFTKNTKIYTNIRLRDFIPSFVDNLISVFKLNRRIYSYCFDFFMMLFKGSAEKDAHLFANFFHNTNTTIKTCKVILTKKPIKPLSYASLAYLIQGPDEIKTIINKFTRGSISEVEIYTINNFINGERQHETDWFIIEANKLITKKLNIPIRTDYEKLKSDRLIKRVNLLLDKSLYIQEVELLFSKIGKTSINKDDIDKFEIKEEEYYGDYREIFYEIKDIIKNDSITYNEIALRINGYDWLHFQTYNFYKLLQQRIVLPRLDEIREVIGKWCEKTLNDPTFSFTMHNTGNGGYSTSPNARYFWYFVKNKYYTCKENILLDLLSFDSIEGMNSGGIKYIEEHLPFVKIRDRILNNIKSGIEVEIVWENHLDFCMSHNISEAAEYALTILTNVGWTDFLRKKALECVLQFNDDEETAEYLINNVDKQFRWNVFDRIDKYANLQIAELTKILNNDQEPEKSKAAFRLIKFNQLNGFEYIVNLIISTKSATIYNIQGSYFNSFTNKAALPSLYKLIEICYSDEFADAPFYSIKHNILGIIKNIIVANDNLDEVINGLNKIIDKNKTNTPEITNINYSIKDVTNYYYQIKSENISIQEAISLVEGLG